jgi:hypothetical protein
MNLQIESFIAFPVVECICAQSVIRRIRSNSSQFSTRCMTTEATSRNQMVTLALATTDVILSANNPLIAHHCP